MTTATPARRPTHRFVDDATGNRRVERITPQPDPAPAPKPAKPAEPHPRAAATGERTGAWLGRGAVRAGQAADSGAGVLLGFVLWAGTMAYLNLSGTGRGGVLGVRDLIRAKFVNKGRDGEWLP